MKEGRQDFLALAYKFKTKKIKAEELPKGLCKAVETFAAAHEKDALERMAKGRGCDDKRALSFNKKPNVSHVVG